MISREEVYSLRWAWHIQDYRLIERIDVSITRKFLALGYTRVTGDLYLQLHRYSSIPKRDMMTAFLGKEGAFLLCIKCSNEDGGPHLHITSYANPPDPQNIIYSHLQQVNDFAKRGTLFVSRIQEAEGVLAGGWRWLLATVSLLGGIGSFWTKPFWKGAPIGAVLDYLFGLVLIISLLYVFLILVLVVLRSILHLLLR